MKKFFAPLYGGLAATAMAVAVSTSAWAFSLNTPESLTYRVHYGLIHAGNATMTYVPSAKGYTLNIGVRDSTVLIDLNNRYTMQGTHKPQPFTSSSYHAVQKENDYRADKVVVFDAGRKHMRYTNRRDANDTVAPQKWDGKMRDVFAQLYAMRTEGLAPLKKARRVAVMGVKEPFTLVQSAAVAVPNTTNQWQVKLQAEEDGKLSRDTWRITVREEADKSLTPVKIQAQTRFGTFSAALKEPTAKK
jgi:Protein of unknown function (DUF3108)